MSRRLDKDKPKPPQTSFRLDTALLARMDVLAAKMQCSRATVIRMSIERGLGVVEASFDKLGVEVEG